MGLAHEKKSYLQEKNNLFEIGSIITRRRPKFNLEYSEGKRDEPWKIFYPD